ncbi:hypothetical protein [Streptomyces sp. NPDC059564]|uniref:hypothetical protein n=1 Tax=Streptomyces sp. NPDC059564 TaxID=3346865 RepID=UPI0036CB53FC
MTVHLRPLRIAAHVELVSLIAMLANLATAHLGPISSLMGPTHGCAYLFVVIAVWRPASATATTKAVAVVPGVGGLLALRRLHRLRVTGHPTKDLRPAPRAKRRPTPVVWPARGGRERGRGRR